MRLFTAVEIGDRARAAIASVQQTLVRSPHARQSLRLVPTGQLHLTLVFIGEVSDERGGEIVDAMKAEVPLAPFRVTFGGIGAFPPRGAPRVVWVGLTSGTREMLDLYRHIADRLIQCHVELDRRAYHPHLTLGRWRDSRASDRPGESSPAEEIASVEVADVALFQSRLSSSGATHSRLATARLTWR